MRISVTVKANSKKPGIEVIDEFEWVVKVKEPAIDGRANEAVIESISVIFSGK
jgi:uncharacterized protein YggU (UPF0235/DUF167 family)